MKGRDRDLWVRLMTSTQLAQIKTSASNSTDKLHSEGRRAAPLAKTRDRSDRAQLVRGENSAQLIEMIASLHPHKNVQAKIYFLVEDKSVADSVTWHTPLFLI